MPNFIALGTYFIFGTKFSWNEVIDTCFNVECVLLGRNFRFLGGYLEVSDRYLMVTARCCSLPGTYCSLLKESTDRQKTSFLKETVENAGLHIAVLDKAMTTQE